MEHAGMLDPQLGEAVRMVAIALRAGYPITMIFEKLAEELPQPIAGMFLVMKQAADTEENIIEALESYNKTLASPHLDQVIAALWQHHNHGGNLADLLEPVGDAIIAQVGVDAEVREASYTLRKTIHAL